MVKKVKNIISCAYCGKDSHGGYEISAEGKDLLGIWHRKDGIPFWGIECCEKCYKEREKEEPKFGNDSAACEDKKTYSKADFFCDSYSAPHEH